MNILRTGLSKAMIPAAGLVGVLRGFIPPGRRTDVRDGDMFLVSYPRSGNTWMRFLIANLLRPDTRVGFDNIESIIPDIYRNTSNTLRALPERRMLKSHEYFDPRYSNVLYLVRNPAHVAVSYYMYLKKVRTLSDNDRFADFLKYFVEGRLDDFGNWSDHVSSWMCTRKGNSNFKVVRYEDVQAEPGRHLEHISRFLKLSADIHAINRAVTEASRDRMAESESTKGHRWVLAGNSREDIPFVSDGCTRNDLRIQATEFLESFWQEQLQELGYLNEAYFRGNP